MPSPSSESAFSASNGNAVISDSTAIEHHLIPTSLAASALGTDLDIGSVVQVDIPGSANKLFGVIRWIGILRDRDKPFVGVELVSSIVSYLELPFLQYITELSYHIKVYIFIYFHFTGLIAKRLD